MSIVAGREIAFQQGFHNFKQLARFFLRFLCAHKSSYVYSHVCTKVPGVWTTTQSTRFISVLFQPCHSIAPLSSDKTCYRVILPAKVFRTQVHMSSRSSAKTLVFWALFTKFVSSVLDAVRNRTKILSWSFFMSLFLWSTVWCSLLILRMSWSLRWDPWCQGDRAPLPWNPGYQGIFLFYFFIFFGGSSFFLERKSVPAK